MSEKKGRKRKMGAQEPGNIKRWRAELEEYTNGQTSRPENIQKRTAQKDVPTMSRKERRKEERKLKKMRRCAYQQHSELPTRESLERQRHEKVKKIEKLKKKKEKRKRNLENKRARQAAEQEEEDNKRKTHQEEAAKDDRTIKQLEKRMKMNKRKSKSLPQAFHNDGLDFLLDVLDSDKAEVALQEDDMEELDGPLISGDSEEEDEFSDQEHSSGNGTSDDEDVGNIATPEVVCSPMKGGQGILKKGEATSKRAEAIKLDKKMVTFNDDDDDEKDIDVGDVDDDGSDDDDDYDGSEDIDREEEDGDENSDQSGKKTQRKAAKSKQELVRFITQSIAEVKAAKQKKGEELPEQLKGVHKAKSTLDKVGKIKKVKAPLVERSDQDDTEEDLHETDDSHSDEKEMDSGGYEDELEEREGEEHKKRGGEESEEGDMYKEDIYGRLRDKEGNIVTSKQLGGAYVPPGKRLQMSVSVDEKTKAEVERMKKQIKGLINRLSESNMQAISSQIEEMFRFRSRAQLTETLSSVVMEACVLPSLTPERLVSEQMLLLAILQANVGSEVGALFLQRLVEQFNSLYQQGGDYGEGKKMENVLVMLANMYNFKMIHAVLIFDVIKKLIDSFTERDIGLILVLLKNVGFSLRRDDPTALKEVVVHIQEKATAVDTSQFQDESRVKFMLEVLMAIRNNNMRRIPNYDPSHVDHLRKVLRNYTKGAVSTESQLRVTLQDLLEAEMTGRWWLVGSAWSGRQATSRTNSAGGPAADTPAGVDSSLSSSFSERILELARQQRMNTDVRRNIFCLLLTSEDFTDAFEKLLRLKLTSHQEREIIHVILDVALQENSPNPFYFYLTQKFCEFHRRFQMTFQFSFWDRLKVMSEMTSQNIINLSALLSHLIVTKAVSLSVLKVIEFSELDKQKLLLLKTLLRSLLMDHQEAVVTEVFARVAPFAKLAPLREALRVFMTHFLLRRLRGTNEGRQLQHRIDLAEGALGSAEGATTL